jgi:hypothetical protein
MWRICDSQQLVGPQVRRCGAAEDMSVSDRDQAGAFYMFLAVGSPINPVTTAADRTGLSIVLHRGFSITRFGNSE